MIPTKKIAELIENQDHRKLFDHMGWVIFNHTSGSLIVGQSEQQYEIIAKLRGFVVFKIQTKKRPTLKKRERIQKAIERRMQQSGYGVVEKNTNSFYAQNIVIYHVKDSREQIWSYPIYGTDRRLEALAEISLSEIGSVEPLVQLVKNCDFSQPERKITCLLDVAQQVNTAFV